MMRGLLLALGLAAALVSACADLVPELTPMPWLRPAHSWYDPACCSDNDCHELPRGARVQLAIRQTGDGAETVYLVTWPDGTRLEFPAATRRRSQDGGDHACISAAGKPLCLYLAERA
jgi:hypothetical protein